MKREMTNNMNYRSMGKTGVTLAARTENITSNHESNELNE